MTTQPARWILLTAAALFGGPSVASAQAAGTIAQDDASHYATGSYSTGANAGTGFSGPFAVSGPGGQFIGDSSKNGYTLGPGINTSGKAFGLFQGETATRQLSAPLLAGQTFSVSFDNGLISDGLSDRFELLDAQGKTAVTLSFIGGGQDYLLNGADTGVKFTDGGLLFSLTLKSGGHYSVKIKRLADGTTVTLPGDIAAGAAIKGFRVTDGNTAGGAPNDLYFNSVQVSADGGR